MRRRWLAAAAAGRRGPCRGSAKAEGDSEQPGVHRGFRGWRGWERAVPQTAYDTAQRTPSSLLRILTANRVMAARRRIWRKRRIQIGQWGSATDGHRSTRSRQAVQGPSQLPPFAPVAGLEQQAIEAVELGCSPSPVSSTSHLSPKSSASVVKWLGGAIPNTTYSPRRS